MIFFMKEEIWHSSLQYGIITISLFWVVAFFAISAAGEEPAHPSPRTIRVVLDDNYPPYIFKDSDGKLRGILPDLWQEWEKRSGIHAELHTMHWAEAQRRMQAGEFDVIDTIFRNEDREKIYDFSEPYAHIDVPVIFRSDISGIHDVSDLKDFAVGVKSGDSAINVLLAHGITNLVQFDSYEEIIAAARDRKINVFIIDKPPAYYYLYKFGIIDQFRETKPIYTGDFHFAVLKGNYALLQTVESGFAKISKAEYQEIEKRWNGAPLLSRSVMRYLLGGSAVAVVILAGLFLWIGMLRRIVGQRTKELIESRENYRRLTEEINDAIYEIDAQGRITYFSPVITNIIGYMPEELVGLHFSSIIFPDDIARVKARFQEVLSGLLGSMEYRVLDNTGNFRWVKTSSRPIITADGPRGLRGILTDINKEKHERIEKEKLFLQIQENLKLEAIGTLAGGIAHDFNNILSAIIGFSEITKMNNAENGGVCGNMDRVLKAAERARGLVRQILTFSKKSQSNNELVEPKVLIREGIELLSGSIPKTIKIVEEISENAGFILVDPSQFSQIFVNLCTNAYYAMKENGGVLKISLDTIAVHSDTSKSLSDLHEGPYVRLRIKDSGCGIPQENLSKIFEPFFTTKPVGEGTGLGLSVIHGLIRSMGGAITAESTVGYGSEFTVYLPQRDHEIPEKETSIASPSGNGEHILIVDDEEMLAFLGKELLISLGYSATSSTSGEDCLKKFREKPNRYDAVITDQTMPEMTGIQLAARIMAIRPDIPVIICTGYSETLDERKASEMHIAAFLYKPYRRDILAIALRDVLDKAVLDASINRHE